MYPGVFGLMKAQKPKRRNADQWREILKNHTQAEPQGESAQHDEAHPDLREMVNAVVIQGRIMFLPGEICPALRP